MPKTSPLITLMFLFAVASVALAEGMQQNAKTPQAMRQLATISTTKEAIEALRNACTYEPDNTRNWWLLGDVYLQGGNIAEAEGAYTQMHILARTAAQSNPDDLDAQRVLSVSYEKIGDIQKAKWAFTGALTSYHQSLNIIKLLAQKDPSNVLWQHHISVSYNNIGDIQEFKGDLAGALASYQAAHAISQTLAQKDKGNAQAQTALALSYGKLSDVTEGVESKAFLQNGKDILERLNRENRLTAEQKELWLPAFQAALAQ